MQIAKCKVQNQSVLVSLLHFTFCTLHFAFLREAFRHGVPDLPTLLGGLFRGGFFSSGLFLGRLLRRFLRRGGGLGLAAAGRREGPRRHGLSTGLASIPTSPLPGLCPAARRWSAPSVTLAVNRPANNCTGLPVTGEGSNTRSGSLLDGAAGRAASVAQAKSGPAPKSRPRARC